MKCEYIGTCSEEHAWKLIGGKEGPRGCMVHTGVGRWTKVGEVVEEIIANAEYYSEDGPYGDAPKDVNEIAKAVNECVYHNPNAVWRKRFYVRFTEKHGDFDDIFAWFLLGW